VLHFAGRQTSFEHISHLILMMHSTYAARKMESMFTCYAGKDSDCTKEDEEVHAAVASSIGPHPAVDAKTWSQSIVSPSTGKRRVKFGRKRHYFASKAE
jgi:hypothetical protein